MSVTQGRVLISGGSGFIGSHLSRVLKDKGYQVSIISRSKNKGSTNQNVITWDQIKVDGLPPCDSIVHLAGAGIVDKRWTASRKQELLNSRIVTLKTLINAISKKKKEDCPKSFLLGSAVGYYPTDIDGSFDENYQGDPGDNFGGYLVSQTEKAFTGSGKNYGEKFLLKEDRTDTNKKYEEAISEWANMKGDLPEHIRKVIVRTGIVLDKNGGALPRMALPFKFGIGGKIASGKQHLPWIHREDIVGFMQFAIENPIHGVFNGVANNVTNQEFTNTLASTLHRPALFPVPEFALKILLGEASVLLVEGAKIIPKRTKESGYQFKFENLEDALRDIYKTSK